MPGEFRAEIEWLRSRIAKLEQAEATGEKVPYEPPTEIERLRDQVRRLQTEPVCLLAGPGRGDCEHFVGLPGQLIPGQHDGDDDTVDHYGKPNGWCWHCWLTYQRDGLSRQLREAEDQAEQLRTQLAGCLTAAEGATNPEHVANRGDYGWSLAYEQTLQLHREYDQLRHRLELIEAPKPEGPPGPSAWDRLRDGKPEVDEMVEQAAERLPDKPEPRPATEAEIDELVQYELDLEES